jgi:hypothetical protein
MPTTTQNSPSGKLSATGGHTVPGGGLVLASGGIGNHGCPGEAGGQIPGGGSGRLLSICPPGGKPWLG